MKTLLAILSCVWFTAALSAHSATDPAPRPDNGWKERQALLNQRAASAGSKARVVFVGDSITQGWEGAGKATWERRYAGLNAVNLGIGGDRTQHVLWRLDNGNLNGLKPAAVVVMIGTNNSNGEDNSVDQIAEGVAAIVAKLRAALPDATVLLHAIFPRGENPNPQRGKIAQANQILQKLADGRRVVWVDFGHRFVDARGVIPRSLMPDYLHLSEAGYELWGEALEPFLAAALDGKTATAAASLAGEWTLTLPGPNNDPVDVAMTLTQDGARIGGWVARGADKRLEITDGKMSGDAFAWVVRRDRPQGGTMVYRMSGRMVDGVLKGKTDTEMDGNPVSNEWTAKRK